jgi:hypothetical protein
MTNKGERVARFLDDCAALLDEYTSAFPRPGSDGVAAMDFADRTLWLAKDHGLRTIRGMNRLLRDGEENAVLTCALLRPFYELSVRLLWASREVDGWQRLEFYFEDETRRWENACKDSRDARLVKLGGDLLHRRQEREGNKWRDASGNAIKPAPRNMDQVINEVTKHDPSNGLAIKENAGPVMYTVFYRVICGPSHGHVEALTGARDAMYLNCAGLGTCLAVGTLLAAFIRRTSQSPETDVREMLSRCLRMQLAFGNGL